MFIYQPLDRRILMRHKPWARQLHCKESCYELENEKIVFPSSGVFILVVARSMRMRMDLSERQILFLQFIKLSIRTDERCTHTDSFRRQEWNKCLSFERPHILKEQKNIHSYCIAMDWLIGPKGLSTFSQCTKFLPHRGFHSCPPDLELGALTKWLASRC
jgi:hypothetical protein